MEDQLKEFLADFFDIDVKSINDDFSQVSHGDWDSMTHLRMITALENEFSMKFTMAEIQQMTTYRAIKEKVRNNVGGW